MIVLAYYPENSKLTSILGNVPNPRQSLVATLLTYVHMQGI